MAFSTLIGGGALGGAGITKAASESAKKEYKKAEKKRKRRAGLAAAAKGVGQDMMQEQAPVEHGAMPSANLGQVAGAGVESAKYFTSPSGLASRRAHRGRRG